MTKVSLDRDPDAGEQERCIAGWIPSESVPKDAQDSLVQPFELIALTYTGGWYRLTLPLQSQSRTSEKLEVGSRSQKGKGREADENIGGRTCSVAEYRQFGRWDGWG